MKVLLFLEQTAYLLHVLRGITDPSVISWRVFSMSCQPVLCKLMTSSRGRLCPQVDVPPMPPPALAPHWPWAVSLSLQHPCQGRQSAQGHVRMPQQSAGNAWQWAATRVSSKTWFLKEESSCANYCKITMQFINDLRWEEKFAKPLSFITISFPVKITNEILQQ